MLDGLYAARRRVLAIALSLGVLAASGVATRVSAEEARGLDRILKTGELRVGVSGEQPPLNMTAKSGEPIGMEIALTRVLAQRSS